MFLLLESNSENLWHNLQVDYIELLIFDIYLGQQINLLPFMLVWDVFYLPTGWDYSIIKHVTINR